MRSVTDNLDYRTKSWLAQLKEIDNTNVVDEGYKN